MREALAVEKQALLADVEMLQALLEEAADVRVSGEGGRRSSQLLEAGC